MKIENSIAYPYSSFELNPANIGTTSTSGREIRLAYTGPLPTQIGDVESAAVLINIPIQLDIRAVLIVRQDGKERRYVLDATPDELRSLLTSFFYEDYRNPRGGGCLTTRKDNGLTPYWNGYIQGLFTAWNQITKRPNTISDAVIMSVLQGISAHKLQTILERLHTTPTE